VRVLWAIVLIVAVVGATAAFIGVGPDGATVEGIGVFFALPLGTIVAVAIGGLRDRWDRGFAVVGVLLSVLTVFTAGLLYAAMAVGQGLGALLSLATRQGTQVEHGPLLGVTAVAAIVTGVGCLFAAVVGPPRQLVIEPDAVSLLEP
jgi:hypothetical protein